MNVAVPGIDPWSEVQRNPYIWHFGFHAVPGLPEELVAGKQGTYFDYFYNVLLSDKDAIDRATRNAYAEAYASPGALITGFNWYRTFPGTSRITLPHETSLLILRSCTCGVNVRVAY